MGVGNGGGGLWHGVQAGSVSKPVDIGWGIRRSLRTGNQRIVANRSSVKTCEKAFDFPSGVAN